MSGPILASIVSWLIALASFIALLGHYVREAIDRIEARESRRVAESDADFADEHDGSDTTYWYGSDQISRGEYYYLLARREHERNAA